MTIDERERQWTCGRAVTWVGFGAVIAFVIAAGLTTLVLDPLAAVPGLSLDEIHADMAAAGESPGTGMALGWLGLGVALAIGALLISLRFRPDPLRAALLFLGLLAFGGPGVFAASFGPRLGLADTYYISGGVHHLGMLGLYGVSAFAFVMAVILWLTGVMLRLRERELSAS